MIRNYIKMKKAEFKIKAVVLGAIAEIVSGDKNTIGAIRKLFDFAKNYQDNDFQKDFVSALADIIHNDTTKESDE